MKICLHLQPESQSLGGSEILAAQIAGLLRSRHDVEIVHHRPWLDVSRLSTFAGDDLVGVVARFVGRRPTNLFSGSRNPFLMYAEPIRWGRELAGACDVLITINHEDG